VQKVCYVCPNIGGSICSEYVLVHAKSSQVKGSLHCMSQWMVVGLPYFHTGENTNKYLFPLAGQIHCSCHCKPLLIDHHVNLFLDGGEVFGRKEPKFEAEKNDCHILPNRNFYILPFKGQHAIKFTSQVCLQCSKNVPEQCNRHQLMHFQYNNILV